MSFLWTSFAYSGFPNGGVEVTPGCKGLQVDLWPPFGSQRVFFSLNDEVGGRPKAVTLQADDKYPHDEYPSNKRCDMRMSVRYPWQDRNNTHLCPVTAIPVAFKQVSYPDKSPFLVFFDS